MEEYYENLDRIFSEASIIYDKKILSNFINVNIRSLEMSTLLKHSKRGMKVLEIGCGTGEEAARFVLETGNEITCLEISSGMINFARNKMEKLGIADKFTSVKRPASEIGLVGDSFDLIYSFNGALNTEPRIRETANGIYHSLKDGGVLIFSIRNRRCLGESILYSILGKNERIKDRARETTYVEVVGKKVKSQYYSPGEILSIFERFKLIQKKGLAIIFPPYLAEKIPSNFAKRFLTFLEKVLSSLPFFSSLGDEVIYVFRKR